MQNSKNTLYILKNKWKSIAAVVLMVVLASIAITLAIPATYRTHTELLVVQKQSDWSEDAYSAAQSAERVASVLAQVVPSSSFMDRVMDSGFNVADDFSKKPEDRKEEWQNTVEATVIKNTGIIELAVYHTDKEQTKQISYAIADILMKKSDVYHGGGDRIEIKIFDKPITSDDPVYPNMAVDVAIGIVFGLMLGIGITVGKENKDFNDKCQITNVKSISNDSMPKPFDI